MYFRVPTRYRLKTRMCVKKTLSHIKIEVPTYVYDITHQETFKYYLAYITVSLHLRLAK